MRQGKAKEEAEMLNQQISQEALSFYAPQLSAPSFPQRSEWEEFDDLIDETEGSKAERSVDKTDISGDVDTVDGIPIITSFDEIRQKSIPKKSVKRTTAPRTSEFYENEEEYDHSYDQEQSQKKSIAARPQMQPLAIPRLSSFNTSIPLSFAFDAQHSSPALSKHATDRNHLKMKSSNQSTEQFEEPSKIQRQSEWDEFGDLLPEEAFFESKSERPAKQIKASNAKESIQAFNSSDDNKKTAFSNQKRKRIASEWDEFEDLDDQDEKVSSTDGDDRIEEGTDGSIYIRM
ncbi:uncharacterized protein MONOS_2931 [Monocercomonoides exilis]|uniref:uncharacterized protein n=1 Tax=Monocercomonoides exilis TaxID=2049356 RepID=UPI00355A1814|nr:hypothetical protein MONOS_2931 [Monocercomonoides exilis]|eukprot:MONOS_2931.1-p1 / transcript=MONOS_2931.1 / gene=MONOS_2931 / organism=Monocercomonoides_exilis_PA203 / gene_product=unspecified product / transcript_product=unspecified product / location=Mono_scaffold00064:73312-74178(+) / protein_length=289 / sequence_SO=supercontig / SO=protein_coding / is_pseudo=false